MRRAFPAFVLTAALVSVVACVRPLPSAPEEDFDAAAQGPDAGGSTTGAAGQATNASGGGGHAAASVAAGGTGGTAGTAGSTGGTGGVVGSDAAVPTCSDGIKNSDETGVDCGGHCGKCAAGNGCLVDRDCQFACRPDKTCGACIVAADCPGIESECQHRTCANGVCGMTREAFGTVLAVQTSGDCKRRQCASDGTVVAANDDSDDSDVPDDRNPCSNDICTSGTPSHTMVPAGANCGGANFCNASARCIGCVVAADCPGTDTACRIRTCTAGGVCGFSFVAAGTGLVDPTAGDCKGLLCNGAGDKLVVNNDGDLPIDGNPCSTDECLAGTPMHRPVASGTSCGANLICDGASRCVEDVAR